MTNQIETIMALIHNMASDREIRTALEAALKPVGEPVAWVEKDGELVWQNKEAAIGRNLYTAPPAQTSDDRATELLELFDDPALPEHSGCVSKAPPPRLTREEIHKLYTDGYVGATVDDIRTIETAVRKQFGVNDE